MARPDKAAAVEELRSKFSSSTGVVLTEYRGLTVKALKDLRRSLGENATYAVSKNTLTTIAAREAGVDGIDDHLVGPTAITFIDGDPVVVAKGLRDFARTNPLLVIKAGVLDGKVLDADEVRKLADLESREVLLAKVAGGMQGVLQQAISLVSAPLSQAARLMAALQEAAGENPSIIGGAGTAAVVDQEQDEAPVAEATATEAAPVVEGTTEAAPAAEDTEAAAAVEDTNTVAADAAEEN
ncbi:50S ribosomal protein L10 [uncultured Friedmanniella sp.]|uniref:50S ribosomal protein L10 n=1 Tax=uncultured Friedmanniella sp. TaxID=335381 RepID=UPI0035C9BC62